LIDFSFLSTCLELFILSLELFTLTINSLVDTVHEDSRYSFFNHRQVGQEFTKPFRFDNHGI
jgi:hypothetical protein